MGQMQPATVGLDGMGPFTVFHFHDGVVMTQIDDFLFFHLSMGDIINKCPTDAASRTGIDETVLRPGVKRILAIDKFGVQHHVALLTLGLQVGQSLPVDQVLGTGNGRGGRGGTQIAGHTVVVPLGTEHAVDVAVFMACEPHVVDISRRHHIVGHGNGFVPEAEVIYTIGAFGHGEKALAVGSFHPHHQQVFAIPLDGSTV